MIWRDALPVVLTRDTRQNDCECAPFSLSRVHGDAAAVALGNLLGDVKPQARRPGLTHEIQVKGTGAEGRANA